MRSLAGCAAFAFLLAGSPLAAQEAVERPPADAPAAAAVTPAEAKAQSVDKETEAVKPAEPGIPAVTPATDPAPPPPPPPPPITLILNTDLGAQRLTVTENGKTKHVWPISSGRRGYPTPTGTFRPQWASKMWHSRQYEYAPMPHAVFFHRGTAFHGTSAVGLLGQPASHGCVRLAPGNAAHLFKLVHKHGYAQTKVVVHRGSKRREPAVARRGTRGEIASARQDSRARYRIARQSARRSANRLD